MSLSPEYQRSWPAYFDAVRDQPPRDTLLRALDIIDTWPPTRRPLPPLAIDIACGEGRDARAMVRRLAGWKIMALDNSPEGIARLQASPEGACVQTRLIAMEAIPSELEPRSHRALLVNASFALPFCDERAFPALWTWIERVLHSGGLFAGQFFGDRDDWAAINPRRHITREQCERLLARAYHIEHFEEVEKDGSDAMGGTKHHHVFHVVARRL